MNGNHFLIYHHQMQETRNNRFRSKKRNTILHQVKKARVPKYNSNVQKPNIMARYKFITNTFKNFRF